MKRKQSPIKVHEHKVDAHLTLHMHNRGWRPMKVGGQKDSSKRMMDHIISSFFSLAWLSYFLQTLLTFFFPLPTLTPPTKSHLCLQWNLLDSVCRSWRPDGFLLFQHLFYSSVTTEKPLLIWPRNTDGFL